MLQLSPRSTIALVGSSDGLPRDSDTVSRLCAVLESLGLHTVIFPSLYQTAAGKPQPAKRRAADIQAAFADPEVDALFDLTGVTQQMPFCPISILKRSPDAQSPFLGTATSRFCSIRCRISETSRCFICRRAFWQAVPPPKNGLRAGYSSRTMPCFDFTMPFCRAVRSPEGSAAAISAAR